MRTKNKFKTTPVCAACFVEGEQCFWVNNGPVVKSVPELRQALKEMSDEQYAYHTKRNGNDFSKWAEDIIQCPECAASLRKGRTRKGAIRALDSCC